MRSLLQLLGNYVMIPVGIGIVGLFLAAPASMKSFAGFFVGYSGLFANAIAIYIFVRHRLALQDELSYVLVTSVGRELPIGPSLKSYLKSFGKFNAFIFILDWATCIMLPLYGYVRICIGWYRYRVLVETVVDKLEYGIPLSLALQTTPGVMYQEMNLAVAIGESTGDLSGVIREARRERWVAEWLELAPQVFYPLLLYVIVMAMSSFMSTMIFPKYRRIFWDFDMVLPAATRFMSTFGDEIGTIAPILNVMLLLLVILIIVHPAIRWHLPLVQKVYRWGVQAVVLRTLSRLFNAGLTSSEAFLFLLRSSSFPSVVQNRIERAKLLNDQGETLEVSLVESDLLPSHMMPLVRSAQRTQTLAWALAELGDHLAGQSIRIARRLVSVISPLAVAVVGIWVALLCYAVLIPLFQLLYSLSEI